MQCAGSPMVSLEQLMGGGERGCITALNAADANSCQKIDLKNLTTAFLKVEGASFTTSCDMSHCPPCWGYNGCVREGVCTSEMQHHETIFYLFMYLSETDDEHMR
jgi:hypothetical protein